MKKVLMVAFHYPPYAGGSGVHRTLKFSRYLPEHGWQPIVLSAQPKAYPQIGEKELWQIPPQVIVKRAFALDTARHLSIGGRYLRFMALPDPWISWWTDAVRTGLILVRRHRPDILWSTYPIATAHLIGLTLRRLTGLRWIADFRDSMTEQDYPRDVWTRRCYRWVERQTILQSSRVVFTTKLTRKMYLERYPHVPPDRFVVIPNGYDEEDFIGIDAIARPLELDNKRIVRLVHSGVIYPDDRDPRAFFKALSKLKKDGQISSNGVRVDLRASGSERYYSSLIYELGISDIVHLLPAISHREAIEDCLQSDALLLFQAASCNHQIPAKVYEYLRLSKPILALTSGDGDTAALLEQSGGATVVDLADEKAIGSIIPDFIAGVRNGVHPLPRADRVQHYSRKHETTTLVHCLNELIGFQGGLN
jgi:glycosyltransferase involved in cell wall biosynthesis